MTAEDADERLAALRGEIDAVDEELAALVAERCRIAREIGELKHREGWDLVDEDREAEVKSRYRLLFEEHGLGPAAGESFAERVIDTALEQEEELDAPGDG